MDDFEKELKEGFLDEAAQGVADVEQCFLALETNPGDAENLNKIFRLAHNLKGSSKAVGFEEMGAFTHQFESFILRIKNGELAADKRAVSLLLRANDHIQMMITKLKGDLDAKFDSTALFEEMKNFSSAPPEAGAEGPAAEPSDHEPMPTAAPGAASAAKAKANPDESIRVSLNKVENLLNFVGEMVILQSVMQEQASNSQSPLLKKTVHQLGKVGKEIQDLSMSLRMVPVKPTFQKMQRIVRDTAQALGKDVGITLVGEDTELDKTVFEKINDPLVHLIRNSVDHGIEDAEIRKGRGKSTRGEVKLSAFHQSGKLVLEVADDGGGLDPEKLKKKAVEKGILKPDAQLTEREAFNLIFAPGFSTKEQVTDVSGRGVGMDVVRTNIQELGGEVQIDSILLKGTTFRIILPLTLAIIDGMIITYSNEKFVMPLGQVHETLHPERNAIQKTTNMGDVLLLRGENIPIFRLGDFFGIKNSRPVESMIAMVVRTGLKPFAVLVDDILGQFQVVIKQLGPELQGIKGVSGSTILGDGKPALILEPQDILKRKLTPSYIPAAPVEAGGRAA